MISTLETVRGKKKILLLFFCSFSFLHARLVFASDDQIIQDINGFLLIIINNTDDTYKRGMPDGVYKHWNLGSLSEGLFSGGGEGNLVGLLFFL